MAPKLAKNPKKMENIGSPRSFRISEDVLGEIEMIVRKKDYKYENVSHFIRCALVKTIRDERNGDKK